MAGGVTIFSSVSPFADITEHASVTVWDGVTAGETGVPAPDQLLLVSGSNLLLMSGSDLLLMN